MDYGFIAKSILLQLVVFCIVPFLYWALRKRKVLSFFAYIGFYKPHKTAAIKTTALFALAYIAIYSVVHFTPIAALTQPSAGSYAGLGAAAILPGFFVSFFQQAAAEEILFRGFIGKRLISKFGVAAGNIMQAVIFGSAHVLLAVSDEKNFISYLIIFTSTALGGWLLGFLDEKLCGGSIVPSVLLHGLGNFIMVLSVAF